MCSSFLACPLVKLETGLLTAWLANRLWMLFLYSGFFSARLLTLMPGGSSAKSPTVLKASLIGANSVIAVLPTLISFDSVLVSLSNWKRFES